MQTVGDRNIFLSTLPASRADRTAASIVVAVSAVLFAIAVPFAGVPLTPVPAFVAAYQSALAINDIITAVLLLSQFAILRSRALLLLASGYLFTAAAAVIHALTFPGLFTPYGIVRRRTADHGLALHDLARRLPAVRAGLRPQQGARRRRQGKTADLDRDPRQHRRGRPRDDSLHLARHRRPRPAADAAEPGPLHADHDRRGVRRSGASASRRCSCSGIAGRIR